MQQSLHLLIVDCDRHAALAASYGSKWLLPVLGCGERARALPLVAQWMARCGLRGDVAGQWLGRVTPRGIDWLVAIAAASERPAIEVPLAWRSFDDLTSNPPVLEYQQWAVGTALARCELPSVNGPFGSLSWPDDVRRWIGGAVGSPVASLTPYRAGAHEVVLGADCVRGRVYFKGLAGERAIEARLTEGLAAMAPESFAPTLALEYRPDGSAWWLTAGCPGHPARDVDHAAQALARVQQLVLAAGSPKELNAVDLEAAAGWAIELLAGSPSQALVRGHCSNVIDADVPATWIPMDLDLTNILSDGEGRVRFIDLDDSFLGPAPLAMAVLAARCDDRPPYRTYERSWIPPLAPIAWRSFEIAAIVVQAWLGWKHLERNIIRGEVLIDRDFAAERVRRRLARAIGERSPCQSPPGDPAA